MRTLLIKNARCIATFDHPAPGLARELHDASIFVRGHRIEAIGPTSGLPDTADERRLTSACVLTAPAPRQKCYEKCSK